MQFLPFLWAAHPSFDREVGKQFSSSEVVASLNRNNLCLFLSDLKGEILDHNGNVSSALMTPRFPQVLRAWFFSCVRCYSALTYGKISFISERLYWKVLCV